jgi:transketolase
MSGEAARSGAASRGGGRPNLEVFAEQIEELAGSDPSLLVVTSDSRGSAQLSAFASRMPKRIIEVGIAEQNLVGVAAGLAAGGRKVFAVSPASFLSTRALEQIKHDVCYSDRPVVLVGISAGVSYGALGSTHHSLHDFAALRAMHNITVTAPADNWETREAIRAAAGAGSPVYIRLGKKPLPDLPRDEPFAFGKGRILRRGSDGAFIATGETVWRALAAAEALAAGGASVAVASVHTIKPLDVQLVCSLGRSVAAVVAVEEHSEHGGLGDACARVLLEAGLAPRYRVAAIADEYTVTGSQEEILSHYGISQSGLSQLMGALLLEE